MKSTIKSCPLCGKEAVLVYEGMKGYIENSSFDIYECGECNASFVDPLSSDERIYNHIYRQVEIIPGYTRYSRFAELVKKVRHPLDVLANLETTYWAVRESLRQAFGHRKDISILEIGSGLGYLTYSLNKAGYKSIGLDLSREAVEKAIRRYGAFYEAGDLFEVSKVRPKVYDCIVMTEILEHVENPRAFVEASLYMLKDGGKLILTTPNKSKSPHGTVWQNDVPPVHLWWFSEKSIQTIAESFGKRCEFLDFTPYTSRFFDYPADNSMEQIEESLPRLSENGDVMPGKEYYSWKSKVLGVRVHSFLAFVKLRLGKKNPSARSSAMCAIITN